MRGLVTSPCVPSYLPLNRPQKAPVGREPTRADYPGSSGTCSPMASDHDHPVSRSRFRNKISLNTNAAASLA